AVERAGEGDGAAFVPLAGRGGVDAIGLADFGKVGGNGRGGGSGWRGSGTLGLRSLCRLARRGGGPDRTHALGRHRELHRPPAVARVEYAAGFRTELVGSDDDALVPSTADENLDLGAGLAQRPP